MSFTMEMTLSLWGEAPLTLPAFYSGPALQIEVEQGGLLISHFPITHAEKKRVLANMAARTRTA